jgi:hypothetical protein
MGSNDGHAVNVRALSERRRGRWSPGTRGHRPYWVVGTGDTLGTEVSDMMILGVPIPVPTYIAPTTGGVADWWVVLAFAVAAVVVVALLSIAIVTGRARRERPAAHEERELHEAPPRAA